MIGVIIHEVGHNFFPMIINSDERQWSWMDEGLNTFVEYLTEELWDNKFPSRRGIPPPLWTTWNYQKDQLEPIMTNSENIIHFGPNAYIKPATGLNILRETIMGRELLTKLSRHILKMGVQTSWTCRFIQNDGRCFWRRFRLVLERDGFYRDAVDIANRQSYCSNSRFWRKTTS